MTIFLENPLPALFIGVFLEGLLGIFLVHTRRGVWTLPMLVVLLLTFGGILLERLVVTEREEVAATLDGAADAVARNDLPAVLSYLTPEAQQTRERATWAMGRVEFTSTSIRGLEVKINHLTSPATAEARFNGVAYYRDRRGEFPYEHYAARFIVQLRREGTQWRITDHVEHDPRGLWGSEP